MRNLKRALSLTLASVMLLGMMVVGAGAAGYPDVDENDNVEAIDVLQAVNVMVGDDNGNFGPDTQVNRAQMAVVMAKLLNLDYDYYRGQDVFWDVPEWAKPYVAACYANGIVSGYDANTYGSGDPVTAVQAASMMMRALGYFKYQSDYAEGFELSTVKQASKIRLFTGINADAKTALTRNQVAQLALNALKTSIVEPSDKTINWVDGNGNVIASGGQVDYVVVASSESYAKAINRTERSGNGLNQVGGCTVELGEQLYNGKLKLTDDIDAFNRPARNWEFEGKNIGLYAKEELMEMENVGTVTGKDLYDLLGKTVINDYTIEVALDGVTDPAIVRAVRNYDTAGGKKNVDFVFDKDDINRSNNGSLGDTGVGVLTQVFVDPDYENGGNKPNGRVWIAIINTYLARANQDYDSKREELALNAYSVAKPSGEFVKDPKNGAAVQLVRLGVDEFPAVKDAKENDPFLVTFAEGEVQSAVPAEVLSEVKVSSFKKSDNVVVDGTTYKFTTTAGFETGTLKTDYTGDDLINLKDRVYNIFLDAYDNLIGVQLVDEVKNYVFISALDLNDSNLVNGTANAKALFLDGTVDTIRVNMDKSDINPYEAGAVPGGYNKNSILNTWCTYTKNNSDVYTVKQVADVSANGDTYVPGGTDGGTLAQYHQTAGNKEFKIDKKYITLDGNNAGTGTYARVYGNEKTVYLTAEVSNLTNQGGVWGVIKDVDSVTTGVENANLLVWTDQTAADTAGTDKVEIGALNRPAGSGDDPNYASKGVYTLYNEKGIVIAAVVVGEDDGTARNLVYALTSDVEWESYNGEGSTRADGDGLFTWTRKVFSKDNQEITLTEVSDGNSGLAAMVQHHWYQVKTDGDGNVTGVYRMPDDKIEGNIKHNKLDVAKMERYEDLALDYKYYDENGNGKQDKDENGKPVEIGEIGYTIRNGANTILYWNKDYIKSYLYMDGRTLYVATDDETGFVVSDKVNWVVQQWDNNAKETYTDEGTTATGLDNMIKELNRRNKGLDGKITPYNYQVSAIIEGGIASSVVIFYNENDYNRPNGGNAEGVEATVDLIGVLGNAKVYDAKDVEIEGVAIRGGNRFTVKTGDVLTVVDADIANKNFKVDFEPKENVSGDAVTNDLTFKVLGNVVVNGSIKAGGDETYTLTLEGILADNTEPVKVYAPERIVRKTNVETADGFTATYEIPKDSEVEIQVTDSNAIDSTNSKTYIIGKTKVTNTNGTPDKINFKMVENLTLNIAADDGHYQNAKDEDVATVTAITSHGGVTGTFSYTDSTKGEDVKLTANGTIYVVDAGTLTIDDFGTGNTVIKTKAQAVAGATKGTDYWDSTDTDVAVTAGTNVDLYSANKVTMTGAAVVAKGKIDTADDVTAGAAAATWVPVGVEMTVSAGSFDGYVIATDANVKHGANENKFTMTDNKDVYVYGANKLTLGEGVTAEYGSAPNLQVISAGVTFVDAATSVTLKAADATNKVVVEIEDELTWYGDAVTAPVTMSASGEYQAFTKVTLVKGDSAKQIGNFFWRSPNTGNDTVIAAGEANSGNDKVVGVKTTNTLAVIGNANGTTHFVISDGATVVENTPGSATAKASAAFTIGEKAVEIKLEDN